MPSAGDEILTSSTSRDIALSANPTNPVSSALLDDAAINGMNLDRLRAELRGKNLPTKGLKAALQMRLKEAVQRGILTPQNDGDQTLSPTNIPGLRRKYNIRDVIDRHPFISYALCPKVRSNSSRVVNCRGERMYEKKLVQKTTVNIEFTKKHNLGPNSHPADWFEALMPIRKEQNGKFSIEQAYTWSNLKAHFANAGQGGAQYHSFKDFTVKEILKNLGLYMLNGLSPGPNIESKFSCQEDDPIFGNDLVSRSFGPNAHRRHKEFKAFFSCNDPRIPNPDRKKYPNFKVEPLLKHALKVSQDAVIMGQHVSADEQTMSFQGHHADKLRISYKREGDGFQCDAICSDGYTYSFYFRNQLPPPKYIRMGLSPLHARVLAMLEQLPDTHYTCGMDNLYTSVKFARAAWISPKKVMIHGVIRKTGRGVPPIVYQEEVASKEVLLAVRNTGKVARLKGAEPGCDIVIASVYDTKPVYILSNCCDSVKWIKKEKKIFHKDLHQMVNVPFYRLNLIDFYNNHMDSVDIADQLRGYYRVDHWIRNRKWWWSIYWWCHQMLLTNANLLYCMYIEMHDLPKISHKEFISEVAMAWLEYDNQWPRNVVSETPRTLAQDMNSEGVVSSVSSAPLCHVLAVTNLTSFIF